MKKSILSSKELSLVLFLLLTVTASGALGYLLGKSRVSKNSVLRGLSSEPHSGSNLQGCSIGVVSNEEDQSSSARVFEDGYSILVEKNHLSEKNQELTGLFPPSELGRAMVHFLTFSDFGPSENSAEGKWVAAALAVLEAQPRDTFDLIRNSVKSLGTHLVSEKNLLTQLALDVDVDIESKTAFLSEQLTRSGSYTKSLPMSQGFALLGLLQLGLDSSAIEPPLKQALMELASYNSKLFLLSLYETKYPEETKKIKRDFGIFLNSL